MVQTGGGGAGAPLLQDLEALNQALYQAGRGGGGGGGGGGDGGKVLSRRETMPARLGDDGSCAYSRPPVPRQLDARSLMYMDKSEDEVPAEKKRGLWSWKPFRALAHVGQQKFNCLFTVHVHAVEGLPASVNGLRLEVHFARKDEVGAQTMPARVAQGCAEFQETLSSRCSVHGIKNGGKGMKWESKQFVLSVIARDVDELVLGKHKLELTRLLPDSIDDDVERQDTWTTSFKLSGKAQGGSLVVTFGCEIQGKDSAGNLSASSSLRFSESPVLRARSFNSLPNSGPATPSRYASDDQHSPAMSDPSAEYHMEHLSLDDFHHGSMRAGAVEDAKFQPSAPSGAAKIHSYEEPNEEEEEEEEDIQFNVVEKGVELGTIVDSVPAWGYDAFEAENTSNFAENRGAGNADVAPQEVYFDEAEDRYEENDYEDEKEELRRGGGRLEGVEMRASDPKDSESGSTDDELEMQELLAALGEQERDPEGEEEGTHTSDDLQLMEDFMAGEELLSQLPAGTEWESAKKVLHDNKVLESDDELDDVAGEFLSLLGGDTGPSPETRPSTVALVHDSEPDSPRALLLKQFETEAMIESGLGLNMKMPELQSSVGQSEVPDFYLDDMPRDRTIDVRSTNESSNLPVHQHTVSEDYNNLGWDSEEDVELASIMEAAESELQKATQTMRSKNRARMLEDEETEALMQEWGLNKKVFEGSSHKSAGSFADDTGNPYAMTSCEPPPLGFGLGSMVPLQDGGSLMSMNPANFQATSGSKLVMQVSKPVVMPTEPGSNPMDLLLRLASSGMDGMTDQAMLTMPLDDITGKSVEQIASEGFAAFRGSHLGSSGYAAIEGCHSPYSVEYPQDDYRNLATMNSRSGSSLAATSAGRSNPRKNNPQMGDGSFMSLDDLAPVAMQKIEALAMEGLKIQADMAEEEAPYAVEPLSSQGRLQNEGAQRGGRSEVKYLEGSTSTEFSEDYYAGAEDAENFDDLSMAISLDEWMRLDAGLVDETDIASDTMALVAAHQASHGDIVPSLLGGKQKESDLGTNGKSSSGMGGNTVTLAMLVQLRDPLRNFEPVGAPMMALVQAERVTVPPMPKLRFGKQISLRGNSERYDDGSEARAQPMFKITDVTLSGMKVSEETANDKKNQIAWGNPKQQQSGSRWLVASGMAKQTKNPAAKNTSAPFSRGLPAPFSRGPPAPSSRSTPAPFQKSTPAAPFQRNSAPAAAAAAAAAPAFEKSNPVVVPAEASTKSSNSLWSLTAKLGSRWGGTPTVSKTRNPDVVMPSPTKTGWFGRRK